MNKTMTQMLAPEAQRRFEKALIDAGYSTSGKWALKRDIEAGIATLTITGMPDVRGVLWIERGEWHGMIAIAVGTDGEFPLTGAKLIKDEWGLNWSPEPYHLLKDRLQSIRDQVRRWNFQPADQGGDKAMMSLALSYIKSGNVRKAASILLGALRGEISEATVSESLSIVQMKWAKSRSEMLRSALIWSRVFR